ncbi:MAG: DUF268 domain-containing protein [Desulfobacterales bacterium]|nr:DUF268 domain-containing protein [Desulfobacterales bacterium]
MKIYFSVWLKNLKEFVDPRKLLLIPLELIYYIRDLRCFKKGYSGAYPIRRLPVLFEREAGSSFDPHYVYQAYWAADRIRRTNLSGHHVDISSHVPFVAQLSAHFPLTQLEFRPPKLELPSFNRLSGSILKLPFQDASVHSVTCLHVVEHIGLGRYGDPIDGEGCWEALAELQRIVCPGGSLFLSVPVGKPAVYFNSGYVFDASQIREVMNALDLLEFSYVDDGGRFVEFGGFQDIAGMTYALGLFHFKRGE